MFDNECLVDRAFCKKNFILFQNVSNPPACLIASMLMQWWLLETSFLSVSVPLGEHFDSWRSMMSGCSENKRFFEILLLVVPLSPLMFQVVIFIELPLEQIGPRPWFFLHWLGVCLVLVFGVLWICALFFFLVLVACIDPNPGWLECPFGCYFPIAFWLHFGWCIPAAGMPFLSSPSVLGEWHRLPVWTIAHWPFGDLDRLGSPPEDCLKWLRMAALFAFLCIEKFAVRCGWY